MEQFRDMDEATLLKEFENSIGILPSKLYKDIKEYIDTNKMADDEFLCRMANERNKIKRKETNKRSYEKNRISTLKKDISDLLATKAYLISEKDKYNRVIQGYRHAIRSLSRQTCERPLQMNYSCSTYGYCNGRFSHGELSFPICGTGTHAITPTYPIYYCN